MAADEGIADLLSQRYFLSKILVHLVDSGLHECRRVCRMWCEVCNQLPVKLKLSLDDNIPAFTDTFPNSTVSLEVEKVADEDGGFVETLLASSMSSLRNLRHLGIGRSVQWPLLLNQLEPGSESWPVLVSLSVRLTNRFTCSDFLVFLKFLTGLTELRITGEPGDVQDTNLITEIRNLKSLTVTLPFLAKENGQLIFAASTQLTRLDVLCTRYSIPLNYELVHFDVPLLQVSPYRSNS